MSHAWKVGENEIGVVVEIPVISGAPPPASPVSNPSDTGLHAKVKLLQKQLEELQQQLNKGKP